MARKNENRGIQKWGKMWQEAYKSGDIAKMEYAHAMAEEDRKKLGYSGGEDGSQYVNLRNIPKADPNNFVTNDQVALATYLNSLYNKLVPSNLAAMNGSAGQNAGGGVPKVNPAIQNALHDFANNNYDSFKKKQSQMMY